MTEQQEEKMFWDYEDVRAHGLYNMYDPRARMATGLTKEQYSYVMDNYVALKALYMADDENE